jgi:uncharacterized membrane protein
MAWSIQPATAARPGDGSAPVILPVTLGTSSNCAQSFAEGVNSGTPLQVVGVGDYCTESQPRAVAWTASTGMEDLGTIGGAGGGKAEAVSDDGTVVGWLAGGVGLAFVRPLGGTMQELPKPPDMTYASANDISPNGQFVVGYSSRVENDQDIGYAVRWDWSSGTWQPTQIPSGGAVAVSDAGTVVGSVPVAGSATERKARVWTQSGSVELPGTDTRANDINAAGTVVVGYRLQDVVCRRPSCGKYEVPMVWTLTNGTWVAQELVALDGVDSEANAVAEVDGVSVIVGYGYTKKDAIMRAVYWKHDAQGTYGPPVRLAGLDGYARAFASAQDVNSSGKVVGHSGIRSKSPRTPSTIQAVMWQLPSP